MTLPMQKKKKKKKNIYIYIFFFFFFFSLFSLFLGGNYYLQKVENDMI